MRKLLTFVLACYCLLLPMAFAVTPTTYIWYMWGEVQTVNGVTGYVVNATLATGVGMTVSESVAGNVVAYWGWRIWHTENNSVQTELTNGAPMAVVSRNTNGSGIQSSTWTPNATILQPGFDAFKFILYMKLGAGAWIPKIVFISYQPLATFLTNSTWVFKTFTFRHNNGVTQTDAITYWVPGGIYNTRVEGVVLYDANAAETMAYKLKSGDFIQFLFHPYVNLVGSLFYGLMLMLVCVPTYNRYHSFKPILIMFIIFGGSTGVFTMLVPIAGMSIGWAFLVIGLAGLLYSTFR